MSSPPLSPVHGIPSVPQRYYNNSHRVGLRASQGCQQGATDMI
nr:MAG TPA: hypothetical protein [Caudoviricetes sp.]